MKSSIYVYDFCINNKEIIYSNRTKGKQSIEQAKNIQTVLDSIRDITEQTKSDMLSFDRLVKLYA